MNRPPERYRDFAGMQFVAQTKTSYHVLWIAAKYAVVIWYVVIRRKHVLLVLMIVECVRQYVGTQYVKSGKIARHVQAIVACVLMQQCAVMRHVMG